MSLNWREIDLVLEELDLVNSFVTKIVQPDFRNLYLLTNQHGRRVWLRICLAPGSTRLHTTKRGPSTPPKAQRFVQLLRARMLGGRITEIRQIGRERIVEIVASSGGEESRLYARLWSNAANIVVTDTDMQILDSFFRRPKRGEISGRRFELPASPAAREISGAPDKFTVRDYDTSLFFNDYVDRQYAEAEDSGTRELLLADVLRELAKERRKVKKALSTVRHRRGALPDVEQTKRHADSVMAAPPDATPRGGWITVPDIYDPGGTLTIDAEGRLSSMDLAHHLYDRYKEQKERIARLSEDEKRLEKRLQELDEEEGSLQGVDVAELAQRRETSKEDNAVAAAPGLRISTGGFTILVGRSAQESDQLLRRFVRGNDYWLHVRDHPGGHVFVKGKRDKSVPLDVLLDAGNLALHYSKARSSRRADIYYTQVKYLRRAKHGKTGTVIPTQEKNLTIELEQDRIDRLLGGEA